MQQWCKHFADCRTVQVADGQRHPCSTACAELSSRLLTRGPADRMRALKKSMAIRSTSDMYNRMPARVPLAASPQHKCGCLDMPPDAEGHAHMQMMQNCSIKLGAGIACGTVPAEAPLKTLQDTRKSKGQTLRAAAGRLMLQYGYSSWCKSKCS